MLPVWVRVWTDSSSITSEADGTAPIIAPQLSVRSHRKLPKGSEYAVQIQGSVEVLEAGAVLCLVGGNAGCSVSREPPKLVSDGVPALFHVSDGVPALSHISGGVPALSHVSDGVPALFTSAMVFQLSSTSAAVFQLSSTSATVFQLSPHERRYSSSLPHQRRCSSSLPRQRQSPPPKGPAVCLAEQSVDVAPTSVQNGFSLRGFFCGVFSAGAPETLKLTGDQRAPKQSGCHRPPPLVSHSPHPLLLRVPSVPRLFPPSPLQGPQTLT